MTEKALHQLLNIEPNVEPVEGQLIPKEQPQLPAEAERDPELEQMEQDFASSRNNMLDALDTAKRAAELAFEVVKDKEDAKSFEALNSILKNVVDSSEKVMDLYRKKEDYKERRYRRKKPAAEAGFNIQNAVFAGTPSQLKKFIEGDS